MSHRASEWAFRLEVPPTERFIAVALGDRADTAGLCWPSYRDTSERTGYSISTVKRAIKQLVEWGLLELEKQYTITGKSSSNLYRLRLDRRAPVEVAADTAEKRGVTLTPSHPAGVRNPPKTGIPEAQNGQGCQPDTPPDPPEGSGSATPRGPAVNPSNKNRQSEPMSPAPNPRRVAAGIQPRAKPDAPSPAATPPATRGTSNRIATDDASGTAAGQPKRGKGAGDGGEDDTAALREGFRRLVDNWQQANWAAFVGDEKTGWRVWRKLDAVRRQIALDKWPLCRNAWKAEYARWVNAPKDQRGRRPKVPSVADYCRYELWDSVGEPQDVEALRKNEERVSAGRELCSAIARRVALERVWVARGTAASDAWDAFFARHRMSLPLRKANFADIYDMGARDGETGWRFPSEYPPAEAAHGLHGGDPPGGMTAADPLEEFAELHGETR